MTAIDAMPAPALACVRLIDCPVCLFPRYVPTCWPVEVCPACVGDPTIRTQMERICEDAIRRATVAEAAWTAAQEAAPQDARHAWKEVYDLRQEVTSGAVDKATFLDYWKAAQQIAGLPALYAAWQYRQATVNACTSTLDATQPRLDLLLDALATLEQHP